MKSNTNAFAFYGLICLLMTACAADAPSTETSAGDAVNDQGSGSAIGSGDGESASTSNWPNPFAETVDRTESPVSYTHLTLPTTPYV